MRLHVLVEGKSEEKLLKRWLPRFLPDGHTFKVYPHRGKGRLAGNLSKAPDPRKQGLLDQLPAKLRAFGKSLNSETDRVLVLVDMDDSNCMILKSGMLNLLNHCEHKPVVLFRIAIEETEAFYLGDREAIKKAFPKAKLSKLDSYVQDSICGTWEYFQKVIGAKSEDKVGWAEAMGSYLTIKWKGKRANKSRSFQNFCKALLKLAGEPLN